MPLRKENKFLWDLFQGKQWLKEKVREKKGFDM
jgi:hypothetical protein